MRKHRNIWLLILFGFVQNSLFPQNINTQNERLQETLRNIEYFISDEDSPKKDEIINHFISILKSLEAVRIKELDDHKFLNKVFLKTHRKSLNRYNLYSDFGDTMLSGNYGCLSGTITYALLLTHFGFENEAVELSNHVYLKVYLGDKTILFESTLASRGFLDRNEDIKEAMGRYSKRNLIGEMMVIASESKSEIHSDIENQIGLTELAGLQRYNQAIENYKNSNLSSSLKYALDADKLYPSVRMKYLMQLLVNEILYSKELSNSAKQDALNNYISHIRENKISQTK